MIERRRRADETPDADGLRRVSTRAKLRNTRRVHLAPSSPGGGGQLCSARIVVGFRTRASVGRGGRRGASGDNVFGRRRSGLAMWSAVAAVAVRRVLRPICFIDSRAPGGGGGGRGRSAAMIAVGIPPRADDDLSRPPAVAPVVNAARFIPRRTRPDGAGDGCGGAPCTVIGARWGNVPLPVPSPFVRLCLCHWASVSVRKTFLSFRYTV